MLKGQWRASKLMGLNVYNDANEKLGDINELILDKDGKVSAVVIGVGGFLGMGEHDIAVSMDKLKFKEEAVRTSATTTSTTTRESTTGAATTTAPARTTTANANDWTPDHAVMSATKNQLKALPQFKYSDYIKLADKASGKGPPGGVLSLSNCRNDRLMSWFGQV